MALVVYAITPLGELAAAENVLESLRLMPIVPPLDMKLTPVQSTPSPPPLPTILKFPFVQ